MIAKTKFPLHDWKFLETTLTLNSADVLLGST